MKPDQFSELILKLEEIKNEISDTKNTKQKDTNEVIFELRNMFFHELEAKTGWGRNEVKAIFESAIESVINYGN